MLFKGFQIGIAVVLSFGFPAAVIDANELESRCPDRRVMFFSFGFELLIILLGPGLFFDDAASVFMKALPSEFRAAETHGDDLGSATGSFNRGNSVELGHFHCAGEALPICPKGH